MFGLAVLLDSDTLLGDGLLLHDGPLAAERDVDRRVADLRAPDRLVHRLACHSGRLLPELDVHRDRLGLDPLVEPRTSGFDLLRADRKLLFVPGDGAIRVAV